MLHSSCPSTIPEGGQGGVRHSMLQGIWWHRSLGSWIFLGTGFVILRASLVAQLVKNLPAV